jgi:hypothetical protein
MLASSIEPKVYFMIAAAAWGVVAWYLEGRKKKQEEEQLRRMSEERAREQANSPPANAPVPQTSNQSEQERLRRFLEALGVPSGQAPQPPAAPQRPAPRPIAPPPMAPRPRPTISPVRSQPRPVVVYPPEPLPLESQDPGRLEEPASAIEQMSARYAAMSKGVDLPAIVTPQAPLAPVLGEPRPQPAALAAVREALRTPESLRAAFLLREILGPPKALES